MQVVVGACQILTDAGQLGEKLDQCAQEQPLSPLRDLVDLVLFSSTALLRRLHTLNMTAQPGAVIAFSADSVALISLYSVWIHSSLEPL
jgi:hypothetical protein